MKKRGRFIRTMVACLTVSTAISASAGSPVGISVAQGKAVEGVSETAVVTSVNGKARYSTNQKTWDNLKEGAVLWPGSLIQTAPKAMVDMKLGESGNVVRLFDESVLGIDKLSPDNTQLDLRAGQITGNVKKPSSPDSKYEIKFASGVAGIREGVYQISSKGGLSVREGSAVIASSPAGGKVTTQVVNAGQHFDSRTGKVTSISEAETGQTKEREPKQMPKPKAPSGPPLRPGI